MSTQTDQSTTSSAQSQGSYHWIITLELPGRASSTNSGSYTPPSGATRQDAFECITALVHEQHPEMRGANVMYFALEPNQL
jgi:hypothetical protein